MKIEDIEDKHDFFAFLRDYVCDGDRLSVIDENIYTGDMYYELENGCGDFLYGFSTSRGFIKTPAERLEILRLIRENEEKG